MAPDRETLTKNAVKIANAVIFILSVAPFAFKIYLAHYSFIQRTAFDPVAGFGVISDNTFSYKENTLFLLGGILTAINVFVGCGLIAGDRIWSIIVIIVMVFLMVFNIIYVSFSLGFSYSTCNDVENGNYYNLCNDPYFCCREAAYTDPDTFCPNFNVSCTVGSGLLHSTQPENIDLVQNWRYWVDIVIHILFGVGQLIIIATTVIGLVVAKSNFSEIIAALTGNLINYLEDKEGKNEKDKEQTKPFLKGSSYVQNFDSIKVV